MSLDYSIVIATYERAKALRDALASVRCQTRLPLRVVVVDSSAGRESESVTSDAGMPAIYLRA